VFLGSVKRDPKGQSDWHPEEMNHDRQDDPIVSPDVTGTGPARVIPERSGAEDVFAPFGAQGIVDGNQELRELKGPEDQIQQNLEEGFGPELEMGKETVEAGFVAFEACAVTEPADMPLAGLNQPRDCSRTQIRPAPFGKGQTKVEDYFRKFRCCSVVNHGPFSCGCESVSHQLASENGLFFLNIVSSN
jgi:hypothetical protein